MKKPIYALAICVCVSAAFLSGCGKDVQPQAGSADIAKTMPPQEELSPELKERQAAKMQRGGHDPNNPLGRGASR